MIPRVFVPPACALLGCDRVGTGETGAAQWLVLENPAMSYDRYFICPNCRLLFRKEMQDAESYQENTEHQEAQEA